MILIRLKKRSFGDHMSYAIVVTAKQEAPSTGNFVEKLGHYKPIVDN
jgi:ribosomal protein S16